MKRNPGAENQHGARAQWAKLLLVSRHRLWYSAWWYSTWSYSTWMWDAAMPDRTRPGKIKLAKTAAIAGLSSIQSIRLAVCGS
jgi:hypothetical protein